MKINLRNVSTIFLILGMALLAIGISTDKTAFSWAAVACIVISLAAGGRWMRLRRK